jgi:RNA polymerase sigma factor (TIGR02999 family)
VGLTRQETVTRLLSEAAEGDSRAAADLLPLVYDELRELAVRRLRGERAGHTLQATALVHEAYLRLVGPAGSGGESGESSAIWRSRAHFMAMAARAMRRVLVDHARRRGAVKRGGRGKEGGVRPLGERPDELHDPGARPEEVLALEELLEKLAELDERKARVVEMRVYAGMTGEEIAEALGVARSTVAEDWAVARAWLASQLSEPDSVPRKPQIAGDAS